MVPVLLGDCWSVVEERYDKREKAPNAKGLKINVSKTKAFRIGMRTITKVDPCAVCGKKVGRYFMKRVVSRKWVHKNARQCKEVAYKYKISNAKVVYQLCRIVLKRK